MHEIRGFAAVQVDEFSVNILEHRESGENMICLVFLDRVAEVVVLEASVLNRVRKAREERRHLISN